MTAGAAGAWQDRGGQGQAVAQQLSVDWQHAAAHLGGGHRLHGSGGQRGCGQGYKQGEEGGCFHVNVI